MLERGQRMCTEVNPAHGGYTTADDLARLYALLRPTRRRRPPLPAVVGHPAPVHHLDGPDRFDEVLDRDCEYGLGFMTGLAGHAFGRWCSPSSFGHSGNVGASFAFADPTATSPSASSSTASSTTNRPSCDDRSWCAPSTPTSRPRTDRATTRPCPCPKLPPGVAGSAAAASRRRSSVRDGSSAELVPVAAFDGARGRCCGRWRGRGLRRRCCVPSGPSRPHPEARTDHRRMAGSDERSVDVRRLPRCAPGTAGEEVGPRP